MKNTSTGKKVRSTQHSQTDACIRDVDDNVNVKTAQQWQYRQLR